jgi:hypothetical protein
MVVEENDFIVRSINCSILAILFVREFPVGLGLTKLKCVWPLKQESIAGSVQGREGQERESEGGKKENVENEER